MIELITECLQTIINNNIFPEDFNTSEVYTLVKDAKGNTTDPNNIRIISVSPVITNLFEKLLILVINKRYPINKI